MSENPTPNTNDSSTNNSARAAMLEDFAYDARWIAEQITHALLDLDQLKERVKAKREEISKWQGELRRLALNGVDGERSQLSISFTKPEPKAQQEPQQEVPQTGELGEEPPSGDTLPEGVASPDEEDSETVPTTSSPQKETRGKKKRKFVKRPDVYACTVCGKEFGLYEALELEDGAHHFDDDGELVSLECSAECVEKKRLESHGGRSS